MCKEIKQNILDFHQTTETVNGLNNNNSFMQSTDTLNGVRNLIDVNFYHSSCNHSGTPCGTKYHSGSGHGWCYYCKRCNP